ncbi:MAG: hypothetical protein ABJL67_14395 [Sulfitobacter sp.]
MPHIDQITPQSARRAPGQSFLDILKTLSARANPLPLALGRQKVTSLTQTRTLLFWWRASGRIRSAERAKPI